MVTETRPCKILIADDDDRMTRLLTMTMPAEYQLVHAADGVEAMESAENDSPDLILLDVNMPGLNGFEVLERVKSTPSLSDTKVILITARDADEDKTLGSRLGAEAYFTKPFSPLVLLDTIKQLLTNCR